MCVLITLWTFHTSSARKFIFICAGQKSLQRDWTIPPLSAATGEGCERLPRDVSLRRDMTAWGLFGQECQHSKVKSREEGEWEDNQQSAYFKHRVPIISLFSVAGVQLPLLICGFAPLVLFFHWIKVTVRMFEMACQGGQGCNQCPDLPLDPTASHTAAKPGERSILETHFKQMPQSIANNLILDYCIK